MEIKKSKRQREIAYHQDAPSGIAGCSEKKAVMGEGGPEAEKKLAGAAKAPPSDEEVEEFFAILKRVHEAVLYFNCRGHGGAGNRRWSTALEAEVVAMVCGKEEEVNEQEKVDNPVQVDDKEIDEDEEEEEMDGDVGHHLFDLNSSPKDGH
ncbi:hypothetical protein SAY87_023423 [Trapa incisa]|uniref:Uncharacterized protein n=1 Tax=Trapa incisa TaxID=236973 RepID=A0AAN7L6L8_9MYRT|nr:hypothetical protein SAY87_023423 [Trapa incisa]